MLAKCVPKKVTTMPSATAAATSPGSASVLAKLTRPASGSAANTQRTTHRWPKADTVMSRSEAPPAAVILRAQMKMRPYKVPESNASRKPSQEPPPWPSAAGSEMSTAPATEQAIAATCQPPRRSPRNRRPQRAATTTLTLPSALMSPTGAPASAAKTAKVNCRQPHVPRATTHFAAGRGHQRPRRPPDAASVQVTPSTTPSAMRPFTRKVGQRHASKSLLATTVAVMHEPEATKQARPNASWVAALCDIGARTRSGGVWGGCG
mmetsp:Transcript_9740/g.28915  ORF Transcript_9740/g.28915 Transcript_9740/m.28915 type:complete len:264 (+) Transcript_9740:542-1333(+)